MQLLWNTSQYSVTVSRKESPGCVTNKGWEIGIVHTDLHFKAFRDRRLEGDIIGTIYKVGEKYNVS